ncbi:MAG: hypothetical protein SFX74_12590 [Fimbriimonadaceae bacterium]|nr:hypothetical protein [Fimbriimonadaceae bacterium]
MIAILPVLLPAVTGAQIDESRVHATIEVSPKPGDLRRGLTAARANLERGVATRVVFSAGTYRESVLDLRWDTGPVRDTPLILEGRGRVVLSGSDEIPMAQWRREGDCLVRDWPHRWGNFAYSWGPKGQIGHRSEMLFVDGKPAYPRILEQYRVTGVEQNPDVNQQVRYEYERTHDPKTHLQPGEFGVIEGREQPAAIWYRLRPGEGERALQLEVSTRRQLLDLAGKHRLVVRNLTFTHVANDDRDFGNLTPLTLTRSGVARPEHVLIDRCRFDWNATTGFKMAGRHWTIRDSTFNHNGYSGISGDATENALWQRNFTNFNVWRAWRAGELGYFTGGFKLHELDGQRIEGHTAIGNCTMGAWWDVHCRHVAVRDLVAIGNACNVQFELSGGPLLGERWLVAGGKSGDGQVRFWEAGPTTLRRVILASNHPGSGNTVLYGYRWFGRNDPHSRMRELVPGDNRVERSVLWAGEHVPHYAMIDDIREPAIRAAAPMPYTGVGNTFWHPKHADLPRRWIRDEARKDQFGERALREGAFLASAQYRETGAVRQDPQFEDPDRYDYRFKVGSPLYGERGEYLQFRLLPKARQEWEAFTAWSRYLPEVWNEPTGD